MPVQCVDFRNFIMGHVGPTGTEDLLLATPRALNMACTAARKHFAINLSVVIGNRVRT